MTEPNVIPLSERYRNKPPEPKEADERTAAVVTLPTRNPEPELPCDVG